MAYHISLFTLFEGMQIMEYQILAFYQLSPLENPREEIKQHKLFFKERDITSRIYISEEGINGQMSASGSAAKEYMEWMHSRAEFAHLHFKIHPYHEHVFPRQTVKYRKKLVGHSDAIDPSQRGEHVSPHQWKKMLESQEDYLLIDVRNDYEWKLGHFEGSVLPECTTFRELIEYAETLEEKYDPETTPVMMCCTGGIRCELYSSVLKKKGFSKVYQLDGGIINYGLKEGSKHWLGKLFVFDDRLSTPISEEESPIIGKCYFCKTSSEAYYNCANMECNHLFLCCSSCLEEFKGCCDKKCQEGKRIRPQHAQDSHKPFRRKHHYEV